MPFIPGRYNPLLLIQHYTGLQVDIRGLGVATFLVFAVIVGWIAKGLIGRSLIRWAESLVLSIPLVRSVYSGLKQIVETVLAQGEQNFDRACMVEYPRKGIWAIAFVSTKAKGEVAEKLGLTAGAVKVAVHRFRQRYRECLLSALRDTLAEGEDPEEELRYLLALFSC